MEAGAGSGSPNIRWTPVKVLEKFPAETDLFEKMWSRLSKPERNALQKAVKKLDGNFLLEKAHLISDTMREITRTKESEVNLLLQRNVWSSFDAIALHLDSSGFTRVFQKAFPKLLRRTRLDDPKITTLEWELTKDFLGGGNRFEELDLHSYDVEEVCRMAEKERSGACGLPRIAKKGFTFKDTFANFCGRPDKILDVVHHSATVLKVVAIIVLEIVNAVVGVLAALSTVVPLIGIISLAVGITVFVVSTVIVIVVACLGC
jgi:hypothetical protein